MNLTLYSVAAFLILDSDGQRVLAKYYQPDGVEYKGLQTLKEQKNFEKGLWEKTKKSGSDIILFEGYLAVYKHAADLSFYVIGASEENELMLSSALNSFYDALTVLMQNQVERRALLENYDLLMLALDETIDNGIIVETDSAVIASKVSRPNKADMLTSEGLNEQKIMDAVNTVTSKFWENVRNMQ